MFDPSGTLLVTASVRGHSVYVFQICPPDSRGAKGGLRMGSAVRLFRCALVLATCRASSQRKRAWTGPHSRACAG